MRNYIFGISLLFFTISAVLTFKALILVGQKRDAAQELSQAKPAVSRSTTNRARLTARESYSRGGSTSSSRRTPPEQSERRAESSSSSGENGFAESSVVTPSQAMVQNGSQPLVSPPPKQVVAKVPQEVDDANAFVLGVLGGFSLSTEGLVIKPELEKTVGELVPLVLSTPGNRLIIEGHMDKIPSTASEGESFETSRLISQDWAQKIGDLFMKNGVPREQITAIGYGYSKPVTPNDTVEARMKNRRVVIKLIIAD